jgi:hypothetical protein
MIGMYDVLTLHVSAYTVFRDMRLFWSDCTKAIFEATTVFQSFTTTMLQKGSSDSYNLTTLTLLDMYNDGWFCDLQTSCNINRVNRPTVVWTGEA